MQEQLLRVSDSRLRFLKTTAQFCQTSAVGSGFKICLVNSSTEHLAFAVNFFGLHHFYNRPGVISVRRLSDGWNAFKGIAFFEGRQIILHSSWGSESATLFLHMHDHTRIACKRRGPAVCQFQNKMQRASGIRSGKCGDRLISILNLYHLRPCAGFLVIVPLIE